MTDPVRAALETHLAALAPAMVTAWENKRFTQPALGTPYQRAHLLPADPDDPAYQGGIHRDQGVFQVMLCYPEGSGTDAPSARALALQRHFARGTSLVAGGVTVNISRTPHIASAIIDGEQYCVPVRITYFAHIVP